MFWELVLLKPVDFRAEIVSTTLALRTTKFLDKEVEYMPWETAIRSLNYFFLMFDRTDVYGPMQVGDEMWLKMKLRMLSRYQCKIKTLSSSSLRVTWRNRLLLCSITTKTWPLTGKTSQRSTQTSEFLNIFLFYKSFHFDSCLILIFQTQNFLLS